MLLQKGDLGLGGFVGAEKPGVEATIERKILAKDDIQRRADEEDLIWFLCSKKCGLVDLEVGDEDLERVAANEEEVVVESMRKATHHEAKIFADERGGIFGVLEGRHSAVEKVERSESHGWGGDEGEPQILEEERLSDGVRDSIEEAQSAFVVLAGLFLETGKQRHLKRFGEWAQIILQREVEGLVDGDERWLDRGGGVLEEGEEAACPDLQIAPKTIGADCAENMVVDVECTLMNA